MNPSSEAGSKLEAALTDALRLLALTGDALYCELSAGRKGADCLPYRAQNWHKEIVFSNSSWQNIWDKGIGGMVMMPIKAVLFDLDDTLVARTETFAAYCEQLIVELFPGSISEEQKLHVMQYMLESDKKGYANRIDFFNQFVNKWNLTQNPDQLTARWFAEFGDKAIPQKGLIKTLQYLFPQYKLAIVTNGTSAMQNRKIDALGIRRYFEAIIISEQIGCRKPDRRIYMTACQSLGVDVTEAVFIGDNYQLDVAGPRQVGMSAIWLCLDSNNQNNEPKITALSDLQYML